VSLSGKLLAAERALSRGQSLTNGRVPSSRPIHPGLSGLGNARVVVLGGLAELIAGAISMGAFERCSCRRLLGPNKRRGLTSKPSVLQASEDSLLRRLSSTSAFRSFPDLHRSLGLALRTPLLTSRLPSSPPLSFHYLRKQTHARVLRSCHGEMEREVHAVLGSVGVEESLSRVVAESLLRVEAEQAEAGDWEDDAHEAKWWKFGRDKKTEDGLKWSKDIGVTGFLMKFGEGLGASSAHALLARLSR
jgi:hypothetical protein